MQFDIGGVNSCKPFAVAQNLVELIFLITLRPSNYALANAGCVFRAISKPTVSDEASAGLR